VEEQRTNLYTSSADFSNAAWAKNTSTFTANQTTSPDATANAGKMVANSGVPGYIITTGIAHTAGTTYTHSMFVKPAGRTSFTLLAQSNLFTDATARSFTYTLAGNGSTASGGGAGATATITPWPNGWYLCTLTYTPSASVSSGVQMRDNVAGDATNGFYLWGAQLEAGSFATSYIPTTTAQVTRTADSVTMTGSNFSAWFRADQGTLFAEGDWNVLASGLFGGLATVYDGTSNNAMGVLASQATFLADEVVTGGVTQATLLPVSSPVAGTAYRVALAYADNDFASSGNGAAVVTDTAGTVPTVNALRLGVNRGVSFLNGHIRRIRYYPTRLPNAQLQVLTQ
jgi:hypothetical protein